jgi:N-methylhydantoinase B
VLAERYELLPDSAGAGTQRGGWGVQFDFRVLRPDSIVTARGVERTRFEPWGLNGGSASVRTRTFVNPGTDREREVGRIDVLHLEPGDVVSVRTAGGAGYGNPLARDPAAVAADVHSGLLNSEDAARQYGVVLRDGAVDLAETEARRTALQSSVLAELFDFGPSRRAYEEIWTSELSDALVTFLMTLPPPLRAYAKREIHRRVDARGTAVAADELPALWADISSRAIVTARGGAS